MELLLIIVAALVIFSLIRSKNFWRVVVVGGIFVWLSGLGVFGA